MKIRNCKLCGQPLNTKQAVDHVRDHGRSARRLNDKQRAELRRNLIRREVQLCKGKRLGPEWFMRSIAAHAGCSRRTAIRERDWLWADGTMQKGLRKAGFDA